MQITAQICGALDVIYLHDRKFYVPLVACSIKYLLSTKKLTNSEKLFFFLADLYSHLNESMGGLRETEKSGRKWAKLLGCSEEWVFQMQKNLESAGYFKIIREKDEDNQNEKNIIIPTLPDDVFAELSKEPNRIGKEYAVFIQNEHEGCKRSYLDNSKMFITFNLQMVKLLLTDGSLSSLQKLIWLHFSCRSHIAYTDSLGEGTRNFITTYKEVAELFSCSEKTVSTAMLNLAELGYISKKQFRIKEEGRASRRKKKSCWEIAALFPQEKMEILLQQPDRQSVAPLTDEDNRLYGLEKKATPHLTIVSNVPNSSVRSGGSSITKGGSSETSQYYNKDHISKSYINKNNDQVSDGITNNNKAKPNVNNVFIEQELTASEEEITKGLQIAEKFDNKVFELAKTIPYEEAIKQEDLNITQTERWVVTKAAYTLHKNQQTTITHEPSVVNKRFIANDKVENNLTQAKQRLIALWDSFSNFAADLAGEEEFLIRKSWLLKLLNPPETEELRPLPSQSKQHDELQQHYERILPLLPGDKQDKARKFAYALRERGSAKGYAAEISTEELALEFIHHAATWVPERLNCKSRDEQIDAALSFAWRAAEQGRWKCPYQWLNMQVQQREQEALQWKRW